MVSDTLNLLSDDVAICFFRRTGGEVAEVDDPPDQNIDLANITKSVAETDRRRALVEQELDQAQAVVESLKARSSSLSESVLDLQRQLDATRAAKAQEDSDFSKSTAKRKRAIDELSALTAVVDDLKASSERNAAAIGANLDDARAQLATVESSVDRAKAEAASVEQTVATLRQGIAEARLHADELERQLIHAESTGGSLVAVADETLVRLEEARAALNIAVDRKHETDAACTSLAAIGAALHAKTNDAVASMNAMDRLVAEQERQTVALTERVAAIGKLVGRAESENGAAATLRPDTPKQSEIDGRFADSLRAMGLLAHERLIPQDEADRICNALRTGAGELVLRESWGKTVRNPQSVAHRLIFAEVLQAVGDIKASVVYYEQAASVRNSPPVVRYLVALAYLKMDLLDRSTRVVQLLARDRGGRTLSRIIEALRMEQTDHADEAVHVLTEALAARGVQKWEYDEALLQLGRLHERRNNVHAALSCYEQVNGEGPNHLDVLERIRALQQQPIESSR